MARRNKQEELMNTTYVVVAENGIDTFSMKTVTTRLGVSEGLIYKYFDTREGLLFKSFVSFQKEICDFLRESAKEEIGGESKAERRERLWKKYFRFLVESNYKSLFYYEFRWSYRYGEYLKLMGETDAEYVNEMEVFSEAWLGHPITTAADKDAISWVVENTGMFVRKTLLNDMSKDDDTVHRVFKRIFYGIDGLAG